MTPEKPKVITIDGPSGAGKGTISRAVADRFGFNLLDSGALYRITALASMRAAADLFNEKSVAAIAENLEIDFRVESETTKIYLSGIDVTQDIRREEVGMGASTVAAHGEVRKALLERQRRFAKTPGLVADGRDMGTVVFPDADLKIFLTASASERARRRVLQLEQSGQSASYDDILKDIEARDEQDSTRTVAPLKPARDAIELDSTRLDVFEVLERVLELAREKGVLPNAD